MHGFRSSFKDRPRPHDVDELLSEFALGHVEGSATVAAYARDDLLEKRRPVMQRWADCIAGSRLPSGRACRAIQTVADQMASCACVPMRINSRMSTSCLR